MKVTRTATCAATVLLLAGCSSRYLSSEPAGSSGSGLVYYMPMRRAVLTYERKARVAESLLERAAKAVAAKDALKKAAARKIELETQRDAAALRLAELRADGVPPAGVVYLEQARLRAEAVQELAALEKQISDLTKAANAAEAALMQGATPAGWVDKFTIALQPMMADTRHRFVLMENHSYFRTETHALKTNKAGLLTSVDSTVTDQTQEAILALARSLGGGKVSASLTDPSPAPSGQCKTPKNGAIRIEQSVDPTSQRDLDAFMIAVNNELCGSPVGRYAALAGTTQDPTATGRPLVEAGASPSFDATALAGGIAYRRELPWIVLVMESDCLSKTDCSRPVPAKPADPASLFASFVIEVPNHSPIEVLPMEVARFGKASRKVQFDSGMLLSVDSSRDSEAAKVAALPLDVVRASLGAVGEVVKLRIDIATDKASLAEAKQKQAAAEEALRDALEKLKQPDPPPDPVAE